MQNYIKGVERSVAKDKMDEQKESKNDRSTSPELEKELLTELDYPTLDPHKSNIPY